MDKHRGVIPLEQDMKVYEKTLEKRLRDILKIDEKQFSFQILYLLQISLGWEWEYIKGRH